ncbi:MAG: hypothetical protein VR75_15365 [Hyphomonadaceae bacterium BRH_c29]|jgi:septal ring-binding cell division protein DamX|nr:MAG: hypothetical protein VR75_15365 [Hyphomonadaceae bacterium BRH_c29]
MKRFLCISAIGLAALASACASPTTQTAAANVGPNGEPLICRSIKETGTRFAKKECKTAEAWVQFDAYTNGNAKESTDKFQRLQSGAATNAGG